MHREEVVILKLLSAYKPPRESDPTRAATNPQTSHNSEAVTGDTPNSAEASSVFIHLKPNSHGIEDETTTMPPSPDSNMPCNLFGDHNL